VKSKAGKRHPHRKQKKQREAGVIDVTTTFQSNEGNDFLLQPLVHLPALWPANVSFISCSQFVDHQSIQHISYPNTNVVIRMLPATHPAAVEAAQHGKLARGLFAAIAFRKFHSIGCLAGEM
jgi:hypothetical protein